MRGIKSIAKRALVLALSTMLATGGMPAQSLAEVDSTAGAEEESWGAPEFIDGEGDTVALTDGASGVEEFATGAEANEDAASLVESGDNEGLGDAGMAEQTDSASPIVLDDTDASEETLEICDEPVVEEAMPEQDADGDPAPGAVLSVQTSQDRLATTKNATKAAAVSQFVVGGMRFFVPAYWRGKVAMKAMANNEVRICLADEPQATVVVVYCDGYNFSRAWESAAADSSAVRYVLPDGSEALYGGSLRYIGGASATIYRTRSGSYIEISTADLEGVVGAEAKQRVNDLLTFGEGMRVDESGHMKAFVQLWGSAVPTGIDIAGATVAKVANKTYRGKAIKPSPKVTLGGTVLKKGTDYTLSYKNNVNVGTATLTITGKGNYSGTKSITFKIVRASVAKAAVAKISSRAYTGKAIKPSPKVTLGGRTLKRGTDYIISYTNNKRAGTATVTVKGKGNYKGTTSVKFKIVAPKVKYRTHVQDYGDQALRSNGVIAGTVGEGKRLESIRVSLGKGFPVSGGVKYRTHVEGYGWMGWKKNGRLSGTSGEGRRLEAIQIKLTGNMAKKYDVWYRVNAQEFGWMGWTRNGKSAGTTGYSYRLEAIQIVLKPKGSKAPAATYKGATRTTRAAFREAATATSLYDVYLPVLQDARAGRGVFAAVGWDWGAWYALYDFEANGIPELLVHSGKYDSARRLDVFTSTNGNASYLGYIGATRVGGISGNDAGEFFTHHSGGGGYGIRRSVYTGGTFQSEWSVSISFRQFDEVGDAPLRAYIDEVGARYLTMCDLNSNELLSNVSSGGSYFR